MWSAVADWDAVVADEFTHWEIDFSDKNTAVLGVSAVAVENGAHPCDDGLCLGLIGVVDGAIWNVVAEFGVLDEEPEDVHAEAINTLVKPGAHGGVHCLANFGVAPVEIGLFA
jgi:hypothetical protein